MANWWVLVRETATNWVNHNASRLGAALVLLRHKFLRPRTIARVLQYGHRDKSFTSASMIRMRMVAIESGMCRSGRKGGSSGSVTVGKGRFLEQSGGTRS